MYKGVKIYKNENEFCFENGIKFDKKLMDKLGVVEIKDDYSKNEMEKIIDEIVEIMEKMK
jgi:hypothetical protein